MIEDKYITLQPLQENTLDLGHSVVRKNILHTRDTYLPSSLLSCHHYQSVGAAAMVVHLLPPRGRHYLPSSTVSLSATLMKHFLKARNLRRDLYFCLQHLAVTGPVWQCKGRVCASVCCVRLDCLKLNLFHKYKRNRQSCLTVEKDEIIKQ